MEACRYNEGANIMKEIKKPAFKFWSMKAGFRFRKKDVINTSSLRGLRLPHHI